MLQRKIVKVRAGVCKLCNGVEAAEVVRSNDCGIMLGLSVIEIDLKLIETTLGELNKNMQWGCKPDCQNFRK